MSPHPASRVSRAAAVLLVLVLPAHPGFASAAGDAASEAQTLDTVQVFGIRTAPAPESATRTATPARDVPQSISAVSARDLEERNVRSLNEALETVPGVSLTMGEGRRDQVNIRGFSALYDQYLDGFRDDATYYRDLANIERIEVLRGPASVLYGRGSGGGLVNRISKQPRFADAPGASFSLGFGSHGYGRGTLDVGASADNLFAWRLNAAAERSDSFRDAYYLERELVAPSAAWRLGNGTLVVQTEVLRDRRLPDRGIPGVDGRPAQVDIGTYYGDRERDHLDNDAVEARVSWRAPVNERWDLRASVVGHRVDGDFYNTYATAVSDDGTQVERGQYNTRSGTRDGFGQVELVGELEQGAVRHGLLVGVEAGHQQRDTLLWRGSAPAVDLVDPDPAVESTSGALSTDRAFTGRSIAVYAQDQVDLGSHWKALVGGRWDRFQQDLDDRFAGATLARTDVKFSPRAGVVFQPDEHHSVYGAWSRSFQTSGDGFSLAANTRDLAPETSTLHEIGWKGEWLEGGLTGAVAVFEQTRDGLRTSDPARPDVLIQVGEQRSRGVEFELGGRIGERLELHVGYTRLDAEITRSNDRQNGIALQGNRPANVPEDSASLWGTYALGHGFDLGLGVFAVGDRFSANDNLVRLPGYVRTDAMLRWRRGPHELALNLRNLGGITWYESAHTTHQIMPGSPRTLALTWRVAYE